MGDVMILHYYTKEEIDFLASIKGTDTYKNIAAKFNKKFNTNISKEAIRRKLKRGLYVSRVSKYTDEQDNFIKENLQLYSYKKLREMFYEKYGIEITEQAIADRRRRKYYSEPTKYSDKVDFRMYWCEDGIGIEKERDGRVLVKVSDNQGNKRENWKYKHHYIWEKHYGPIPEQHRVLFLDGDTRNFNINNLACVPLPYICIMGANKWQFQNPELTRTAIKWCELFYTMKNLNSGDDKNEK